MPVGLAFCAIPYPCTDQQLLAQLSSLLMPAMMVGEQGQSFEQETMLIVHFTKKGGESDG